MILASALSLLSLAAITEASVSAESQHKQKLATIVEADVPPDTPKSEMTRFVPSFFCGRGLLLTASVASWPLSPHRGRPFPPTR
jgi:hypothetical protein